jgi:acetyl/propionyl-CoA carboxylase alpha subunit
MEMNPRLQVEHGITEEAYEVDLPGLQIAVAMGKKLNVESLKPKKYAVEARVYAEDPSSDFMPAPGLVKTVDFGVGPGIRIDSGIRSGERITSDFDAMIAKIIAVGKNRSETLSK